MDQKSNAFLETEPVGRLMAKYAVPCVISLLVAALYNIVDQIFIANADYLGSYGNAANTVVFPLTVVALSIAVMIGDGCCAFVSISLGRNDKESAHKSIGSAVLLCAASGLILTAVYLVFQEPILTLFGGRVNEETFYHAKEYFFWITMGLPFYMFGQALNPIIRSDGSPKFAMASTLAGAFVNMILDPVFIFVFRWGMMGAAAATVLGQIVTAGLAVWYLCRMKAVRLERISFRFHGSLAKKYLPLGICSFLSQISLVMAMAAIQNMTLKYSAVDPVFGQTQYTQIPMAVLATVNKGTFIYQQSLGRAFASTAISMVREVLFGVGFALLLPCWFGLDGVLYSMPVSDLLTFFICLTVIFYTYRTLNFDDAREPKLCEN